MEKWELFAYVFFVCAGLIIMNFFKFIWKLINERRNRKYWGTD